MPCAMYIHVNIHRFMNNAGVPCTLGMPRCTCLDHGGICDWIASCYRASVSCQTNERLLSLSFRFLITPSNYHQLAIKIYSLTWWKNCNTNWKTQPKASAFSWDWWLVPALISQMHASNKSIVSDCKSPSVIKQTKLTIRNQPEWKRSFAFGFSRAVVFGFASAPVPILRQNGLSSKNTSKQLIWVVKDAFGCLRACHGPDFLASTYIMHIFLFFELDQEMLQITFCKN